MEDLVQGIIPTINYVVDRKCTYNWRIPKSQIDFHDITFVYEGESTYMVDNVSYKLSKGDLIYIPKGSIRQAHCSDSRPMQCYAVNFNYEHIQMTGGALPLSSIRRIEDSSMLIRLFTDLNRRWLEKRPGYVLITRAILMMILYELMYDTFNHHSSLYRDKRIEKVKEQIVTNICSDYHVKDLAESVHLNANYLGTLFKKTTGYTIREYTNMIRIGKATDLLSTGEYAVGEVAEACGFKNLYYFSKVFKELKGIPPSKWVK